MSRFEFPGPTSPALPSLALTAPDDWRQLVYPGTLLAVTAPETPGQFTPNVVVTMTRHPVAYGLDEAAKTMDDELQSLPSAQLMPAGEEKERSVTGHSRVVAFEQPAVGALLQVHVLVRIPQGPCADLVHITGTCSGASAEIDYPILVDVINSASLAPINSSEESL